MQCIGKQLINVTHPENCLSSEEIIGTGMLHPNTSVSHTYEKHNHAVTSHHSPGFLKTYYFAKGSAWCPSFLSYDIY